MSYTHILIEVIEREISTPQFFTSFAAAQEEMCRRYLQARHLDDRYTPDTPPEELKTILDAADLLDGSTDICATEAYAEKYGDQCDWKIFTLDELIIH